MKFFKKFLFLFFASTINFSCLCTEEEVKALQTEKQKRIEEIRAKLLEKKAEAKRIADEALEMRNRRDHPSLQEEKPQKLSAYWQLKIAVVDGIQFFGRHKVFSSACLATFTVLLVTSGFLAGYFCCRKK